MGIIIANWSPLHGRGNTANCIAVAAQLAMNYNINVFITHTHNKLSTMENALLKGNEEEDLVKLSDVGLDSLNRAIKTGCLEIEDVKSYCNKLTDNFYLISGTKKINAEIFEEELGKDLLSICDFLKQGENVTFIDIDSGYENEVAKEIIGIADYVIVTLDQTNLLVEDYFNKENPIKPEQEIILMGRFDVKSKYNKKFISKRFRRKDVFALPLDAQYLDALNNHRVKEFFEKNYNLTNDLLFDELNLLVDDLAFRIVQEGITIEKNEEKPKKKFAFFSV